MPIRSYSQTDIVLAGRAKLEKPLLAMIWLAVTSFCLAEPNFIYLMIASAAIVANIYAVRGNREIYFPRLYVNIGIGLATLLLFFEWGFKGYGRTIEPIVAVGHYFVLTITCKLFEQKTNRDYIQLMALSILLFVPAGLICEEIWLAAAMLLFLFLACHTAMVFTVKRGVDSVAATRLSGELAPLNPQKLAWSVMRDWPVVSIRKIIWVVILCVMAMGAGVFVLAPRIIGKTDVFLGLRQSSGTSGFSDSMQLGQQGQIVLSDKIAMKVSVSADADSLPETMLYLRGKTLTTYYNSTWSAPQESPVNIPLQLFPAVNAKNSVTMDISMSSSLTPTVFAPATTYELDPADQSLRDSMFFMSNGCLWLKPGVATSGNLKYSIMALRPPLTKAQHEAFGRADKKYFSKFHGNSGEVQATPKVAQQAMEWTADLIAQRNAATTAEDIDRLNQAIAQRLATRVKEQCTYSLDLSNANPSRDGVEDFLFHMKSGHCQYFASAVAVMCRVTGVDARVAIGYKIDPTSRSENTYIVRERDAHAWVEVFSSSEGWITIEATAASGDDAATAGSGWWRKVVSAWEDVKFFWFEKIIGYDAAARKELTAWLSSLITSAVKGVYFIARTIFTWIAEFVEWAGYVACATIAIIIAIAAWMIASRIKRRKVSGGIRRAAKLSSPIFTRMHVDLLFVMQLLELLANRGIRQRQGQTLRELFEEASTVLGLPPAAMDSVATVYYRWRWGKVEPKADDIVLARSQVEMISQFLSDQPTQKQ